MAFRLGGPSAILFVWSGVILLGGAVELVSLRRGGVRLGASTRLASWVLRLQGNLSLIGVALSAFLLWLDQPWALPGVWLLLMGHSFYMLGGFGFGPFRIGGLILQLGGVAALWPSGKSLPCFALATALSNFWIGLGIWRANRRQENRA
jgi:hypothetical protein